MQCRTVSNYARVHFAAPITIYRGHKKQNSLPMLPAGGISFNHTRALPWHAGNGKTKSTGSGQHWTANAKAAIQLAMPQGMLGGCYDPTSNSQPRPRLAVVFLRPGREHPEEKGKKKKTAIPLTMRVNATRQPPRRTNEKPDGWTRQGHISRGTTAREPVRRKSRRRRCTGCPQAARGESPFGNRGWSSRKCEGRGLSGPRRRGPLPILTTLA